ALDIYRPQLDLIAHRLAHPRRSKRRRISLRLRLLRQFSKQLVAVHPRLQRINDRRESQLAQHRLYFASEVRQRLTTSEERTRPLKAGEPRRATARAVPVILRGPRRARAPRDDGDRLTPPSASPG